MNYAGYIFGDLVNGEGARCSLFVSGCSRGCEGCFNKETWDYSYGSVYTKETQEMILRDLSKGYISGLSILGGNPLERKNFDVVYNLCEEVKNTFTNKDIWIWCGQTFEEISNDSKFSKILPLTDVLVDGKFIPSKANPSLKWRGSSNQNIWVKRGEEWIIQH